jgi:hypothetical protein
MSVEEYYIYKTLIIEYISTSKKFCKITTHTKRKKQTNDLKNINKIKMIFEEKNWACSSYQKKYEHKLKEISDIDVIIKIYKNNIFA